MSLKTCPTCKTEFSGAPTQTYCSKKCMYKSPIRSKKISKKVSKGVWIKCLNCGKLTWKFPKDVNKKFCSHECHSKYPHPKRKNLNNYHTIICQGCGKEIFELKSSIRKFCSRECCDKHKTKDIEILEVPDKVLKTVHDKYIDNYLLKLEQENPNIKTVTLNSPIPDGIIIDFENKTIKGFEAESDNIKYKMHGYYNQPRGIQTTIFQRIRSKQNGACVE